MANQRDGDNIRGQSKVERYGWKIQDEPGRLMMIPKGKILKPVEYQREQHEPKVLEIASSWSHVACGVITVVERDHLFYAIDGLHRVAGAQRRADISELPCIVFRLADIKAEARGFVQANTNRRNMSSVDKLRGDLVAGVSDAIEVDSLIRSVGMVPGNQTRAGVVRCVAVMRRRARENLTELRAIWPLAVELSVGRPVDERLVDGLVWLEQRLPSGESMARGRWRDRARLVGGEAMLDAAFRASAYFKKGGAKVWAQGFLDALNYRARSRFKLRDDLEDAPKP